MTRILLFLLFLVGPDFAQAANLVPCGGPDEAPCQACNVVGLVNGVVTWLVGILGTIAAIMIVYAGIKLVTSGGNVSAKTAAHSMITNVIIGFVIVLGGWLLIDTIMKAMVNDDNYGMWNVVQCVTQPKPDEKRISFGSYGLLVDVAGNFAPDSRMGTQAACTIATTGDCSLSAIQAAGFGALASAAAQIVGAESGCNPNAESRTDTTSDGRTFSVGTWQINLTSNVLTCDGVTLNCPSAFRSTGRRNRFEVIIFDVINEDLYNQCKELAKRPSCNNSTAARLALASGDMGDWACSAKRCGIATSRNHRCRTPL